MQPSDFSSAYMPIVRLLPSWAGPVCWPDTDEISQVPTNGLHHVHMGSPTARGSSSASQLRGEDVAFRPTERRQHLEIRPVSQLNTQPMVSPCMGRFLSRGCPEGPIHFLVAQFLCSTWQPVSSSRPTMDGAGARRSGQGWRVSATRKASSLTAPSTTAQLLWSGMTTSRGARVWCTIVRATSLYAVGPEALNHDAVMRIGSKLRGGGPIL